MPDAHKNATATENLRTQQAVPDVVNRNWREQASLTLWIHYTISNDVGRVKVLGVVFS
jgi:hypothetical protein